MRETISRDELLRRIRTRLAGEANLTGSERFWTSIDSRKQEGNGPNWRIRFNEGEVPAGYTAAWRRIGREFEAKYDLDES
jgi:hypothetical protein